MLNEFYAVTATSVYHLKAVGPYHGKAEKIALKEKSAVPISTDLGRGKYYMIGIGHSLRSYIPEKYGATHQLTDFERDFEKISTQYWGYGSSPIVALFEEKGDALRCLEVSDRKFRDPRWLESTKRVLEMVGDAHPSFFVSHSKGWGLLECDLN